MSPSLELPYELAPSDVEVFRRDGHVCLAAVLPREDVEPHRRAIADAAERFGQRPSVPLEERDTYGKAFLQHLNLWRHDERVRRFVLSSRFGGIAARLLGTERVRIYHDQALFKEPGGGPTPWHQDQYYWPIDSRQTVTMWMPLVDIDVDMGMLTFASGSHREGYLGSLPISDASDATFRRYVEDRGFAISRRDRMEAGDATFHSGWTLHSAPGNRSAHLREVMTVIYVADGSRVSEPVNENQHADLAAWFPGLKPGDLIASELNPLV